MTEYLVTWEISIHAESPEEAAEKARELQLDPVSTATVFDVKDIEGMRTYKFDLNPWE